MRTVAIIQARTGSTRLHNKVMEQLQCRSVLDWVIRAAQGADLDQVVVACPYGDIPIKRCCERAGIDGIEGPEDNVLQRFRNAALYTNADNIVRLTADCPFLDPAVIKACATQFLSTTREWPDGMDVQVIRREWLPMGDCEHVVPHNNMLPQLPCPAGNLRHVRCTLDTPADLVLLREVAARLPKDRPPAWTEVMDAMNVQLPKLTGNLYAA